MTKDEAQRRRWTSYEAVILNSSVSGGPACGARASQSEVANMKDQELQGILIVDDDKAVEEVTTLMIRRMGYACTAVSSGEKAMERLQKENFDIVLSDIEMTGMNGVEFMNKAKERYPHLGFIIMTGYTTEYSYMFKQRQYVPLSAT
jgi:CheY-like chemotaxis protein